MPSAAGAGTGGIDLTRSPAFGSGEVKRPMYSTLSGQVNPTYKPHVPYPNKVITPESGQEFLEAFGGGDRALLNARQAGATDEQVRPFAQYNYDQAKQAVDAGRAGTSEYMNIKGMPAQAAAAEMNKGLASGQDQYLSQFGLTSAQTAADPGLLARTMQAHVAAGKPINYNLGQAKAPDYAQLPVAQGVGPGTGWGLEPLTGATSAPRNDMPFTGAVSPWTGQLMPLHAKYGHEGAAPYPTSMPIPAMANMPARNAQNQIFGLLKALGLV